MKDIGIDLGTKNILIYEKNKGIVLNEPSVLAIDKITKKIISVGKEASEMLGRTPDNIEIIFPMKDGVIADFDLTEQLLRKFIKTSIKKRWLFRPNIIICTPTNITGVEKTSIKEMGERLGAKKVYIEEEVKVALIGAGCDITKPSGSMVVDIGGGTTDIAIISLGSIVISSSIKIAGNKFDQDIINYVKDKYKLIIGEKTAEEVKINISKSEKNKLKKEYKVTGRDIESGLPKEIVFSSNEVEEAIRDDIKKIIKEIKRVLELSPPELSKDINKKGIILTGGGSLIKNLSNTLQDNLKVSVFLSETPLENVINGTGIMLDNIKLLEKY